MQNRPLPNPLERFELPSRCWARIKIGAHSVSLAQQGLRTLIIDGDLRRPSVEVALLGRRSGKPGVTDYLIGKQSLLELVQPSPQELLSYLPAGTTAPNPSELLSGDGFDAL